MNNYLEAPLQRAEAALTQSTYLTTTFDRQLIDSFVNMYMPYAGILLVCRYFCFRLRRSDWLISEPIVAVVLAAFVIMAKSPSVL